MTDVVTIVLVLLMAAVAALAGYFKSVGEKPEPVKTLATLLFGLLFGLYAFYMGLTPSDPNYLAFLGTFGFLIVIIEDVIKGIIRRFINPNFLK